MDIEVWPATICHKQGFIAELNPKQREYLMSDEFEYSVVTVFTSILQALTFFRESEQFSFDFASTTLHEICIPPRDKIHLCGGDQHVLPSDIVQQRVWPIGVELLQHAVTLGESLASVNTAHLIEIAMDLNSEYFYQMLIDQGCDVTSRQVAEYFHNHHERYAFYLELELAISIVPRILPVITFIILRSMIHQRNMDNVSELLSHVDRTALQPYHDLIMECILANNTNTKYLAMLEAYHLYVTESVMRQVGYNQYLRFNPDYEWQFIHIKDLEVVKWLLTQGLPVAWFQDSYLIACETQSFALVQLLHPDMTVECQALGVLIAAQQNCIEILAWLLENHTLDDATRNQLATNGKTSYECQCWLQKHYQLRLPELDVILSQHRYLISISDHVLAHEILQKIPLNVDSETFFDLVFRVDDLAEYLALLITRNFDFHTLITKKQLADLEPGFASSVVFDLAENLVDISFLEFLVLTQSARMDLEPMIDKLQSQGQIMLDRWHNYFAPGLNPKYICSKKNHAKCFTLNLWYGYLNCYQHASQGIIKLYQRGFLCPKVTKYLDPAINSSLR